MSAILLFTLSSLFLFTPYFFFLLFLVSSLFLFPPYLFFPLISFSSLCHFSSLFLFPLYFFFLLISFSSLFLFSYLFLEPFSYFSMAFMVPSSCLIFDVIIKHDGTHPHHVIVRKLNMLLLDQLGFRKTHSPAQPESWS